MDDWTRRSASLQLSCSGREELSPILFSNVFVIRSLIVAGECFAPLPGRLGRLTSGQELQVVRSTLRQGPKSGKIRVQQWCEALSARGRKVEKVCPNNICYLVQSILLRGPKSENDRPNHTYFFSGFKLSQRHAEARSGQMLLHSWRSNIELQFYSIISEICQRFGCAKTKTCPT